MVVAEWAVRCRRSQGAPAGEIWPSATLRYFVAHAQVDSQDKDAYFEALTAAFGALLDSVPRSWSQLKLAYHKVINSHPSKKQIETDKREENCRCLFRSGGSRVGSEVPSLSGGAGVSAAPSSVAVCVLRLVPV